MLRDTLELRLRPAVSLARAACLASLLASGCAAALAQTATAGTSTVPYSLPVNLPPPVQSPPVDPRAPYTPTVVGLLKQLEAHTPPTPVELRNASALLSAHGGTYSHPEGSNPTCHNLANVNEKTLTTPRIMPLCFSDGLGINVDSGPNIGKTTGLPSMLMLASSFDLELANAMGQVEGREGRNLMVTGLLGPQADPDIFINWGRGHHTSGEDPFLNGVMSAAQINGIQGQGLMSQVKHFAVYNGAGGNFTDVQDQAFHEIFLTPYELALGRGGASSIMCSYQKFRDPSPFLNKTVSALASESALIAEPVQTWPLNEIHYACENPLLITYVLRELWKSPAFVASDYGATHSASGILQGADREDSSETYFAGTNPEGLENGTDLGIDATGSTCADANGKSVSCSVASAIHVSGIPGSGCPTTGCGVVNAVAAGTLPLAVFNQALARVLYQEERFGMLGCDNTHTECSNPGGISGERSGEAPLPAGLLSGMPQLGTKNGDAAIAERVAEQGAVLLKNDDATLPITAQDLAHGIAVSGPGAEYLVANPNNEGAAGFSDRNAISPLQQLRALSAAPSAFTYTPANSPTGQPVPCGVLNTAPSAREMPPSAPCGNHSGLQRSIVDASGMLTPDQLDPTVDYTAVSTRGQLASGKTYRWDGWIYIPLRDAYVFRIQHSAEVKDEDVSFTLDGSHKTLVNAASFYHGSWYGSMPVGVASTTPGYVEGGLRNRQCPLPVERKSRSAEPVVSCPEFPAVGWHRLTVTLNAMKLPSGSAVSFRLAYSRTNGDIADAAAEAKGKALALVFVNDEGRNTAPDNPALSSLSSTQQQLISAVSAENPHTVVVINTGTPFIVKEWISNPAVKAVLNMWQTGQEGGTATARLLLGQANPSGHLPITWPKESTDTVGTYLQLRGLYPGDTAGAHPERVNPGGDMPTVQSQGIFSGYRYYDELGIAVQFPFGFGLSYTSFAFSDLKVQAMRDGTAIATFRVKNAGHVAGAVVPQLYVGRGPDVPGVQQAVRALRGFNRVALNPGESKQVSLTLDQRSFQYWSEPQQAWVTNPGERSVFVGDADAPAHLPLSAKIMVAP